MTPTLVQLADNQRLAGIDNEIHSKGHCYLAEDLARHQLLVIAQRMVNVQKAIEERSGEVISLASLFEAATMKLRKGRTAGYRVLRLPPERVPDYLDERRKQFGNVVISATNKAKWRMAAVS